MSQVYTTKLFKNGASQAVRLPAEFRFSGQEVYIFRDEITGDIVLSEKPRPKAWKDFFSSLSASEETEAFMAERPMNVAPASGACSMRRASNALHARYGCFQLPH